MNCLELHSVYKSFDKKEVLSDVSFTLKSGEILGLFGKNGSGKSTLLKILFGSLKADSLDLRYNGSLIPSQRIIQEQVIGYLPQHHFLPKNVKVRDIIPYFYENGEDQDLIFRAPFIERIAKRKIGTLSLGELRYLEILLVAHLDHPFLLLDEPFSMIEPLYKERIKELLIALTRDNYGNGLTTKGIIMTDHYYPDVLEVATKSMVIVNGVSRQVKNKFDLQKEGYIR